MRYGAGGAQRSKTKHKDLNYKPAKEREREKWSLQIITHFVQERKESKRKTTFLRSFYWKGGEAEADIDEFEEKKNQPETCCARGESERETRNAVWIECTI